MIELVNLDLGSTPLPGERWRVVVRDDGYNPSGAELGQRWYDGSNSGYSGLFRDNGLATLQLGYPHSQPIASGRYFVMDVRFGTLPVMLPLSSLVHRWTERLGGEVVRVKRVSPAESSSAGQSDRVAQLQEALEDAPLSAGERIRKTGERALDVLQLAGWAIIVGGVAYLLSRAMTLRK